jgi:zinc protease
MIFMMMALACAPKQVEMGPIPEIGEAGEFTPVEPQTTTLESGARLWLVEDSDLPVAVIRVLLPGGASSDGGAWGQADVAAQMLTESVGDRSSVELAGELRLQASSLWARAGRVTTEVGFSSHVDRLEQGLPLLADALLRPTFAEDDWERIIDQQIQGHKHLLEDGMAQARAFDQYYLYGSDHPLGTPSGGVPSTLEALDREATLRWHQSRLLSSEIDIVIVGALSLEEAREQLDAHLSDWPGADFQEPVIPEVEMGMLPGVGRLLLVDLPDSQQTAVRILSRAWEPESEVASAADLAGIALGGSFTSRLNHLLRETKGYTYGAYCGFWDGLYGGIFVASTNVRTDATVPALMDLNGALIDALRGFGEDELTKARSQARNDAMDSHASRSALASALTSVMAQDRGVDELQLQLERSQAVDLEQMKSVAPLAIPERGLMLLVGDEAVIGGPLREAGIEYERVVLPQ